MVCSFMSKNIGNYSFTTSIYLSELVLSESTFVKQYFCQKVLLSESSILRLHNGFQKFQMFPTSECFWRIHIVVGEGFQERHAK